MSIEKKTIRSDIPGHHTLLNGSIGYIGSPSDETRRMVVGRDIVLTGMIESCQHLIIEGTVKAEAFSARRLDIVEPGLFSGTAEVQDAVIAGRFEGSLTVTGRLTIKSTGRISGDVTYGIMEVDGGGKIEGSSKAMPQPEKPVLPSNVAPLFDTKEQDDETVTQTRPVLRRAAGSK